MDLSVLKQDGIQTIRLRGRLTLGAAVDSLRDALDDSFAAGDHDVMMNLAEVPMIDSSGIGLLVRSQTTAKQQGGSIKLVQPTDYTVKTLKMVGLLNLFEIFNSEEDAIASFVDQ